MASSDRYTVEDPRFAPSAPPPEAPGIEESPPRRRRRWLAGCLLGCLGVAVVLLLVLGLVMYWLVNNWREVASNVGAEALKHSIDAADLPPAEKQQIAVQIDRVAAGFREGRINDRQMQAIFHNLIDSPLLTLMAARAIENKYVARSGLDDQEKAEARQTLRRYLRAAIDGDVDEDDLNAAMKHVADRQQDGSWRLKAHVDDDELRAFLSTAKDQADAANIPAEPEDIDPSEEFKRIIDDALGVPAQPPLAEQPLP